MAKRMNYSEGEREQRRFRIYFKGLDPETQGRYVNRGYGTKDPSQADPKPGDRMRGPFDGPGQTHEIEKVERIY